MFFILSFRINPATFGTLGVRAFTVSISGAGFRLELGWASAHGRGLVSDASVVFKRGSCLDHSLRFRGF